MLRITLCVMCLGLACAPMVAQGAIMAYDNHATWAAAAGGVTGSENFNSFSSDTLFDGSSVALAAGMSIGTIGAEGSGNRNFIDVPELVIGNWNIDNSAYAMTLTCVASGGCVVKPFISFGTPVHAFGADFKDFNSGFNRSAVEIYNGSTLLTTLSPSVEDGLRFWGFVADAGETLTELRFATIYVDAFGIDNIEIAAVAVPEPTTMLLLGSGLMGLAGLRKKFKK